MNNKFGIFSTNDSIVIKVIVVCQYYLKPLLSNKTKIHSLYHKSCKNHFTVHWSRGPNNNNNTVRWCIAFTFTMGHVTYGATAWTVGKYTRPQLMAFTGPAWHTLHRLREGRPTRQAEGTMHPHATLPYVRFHSQAFEGHTCRKVMYKMCTHFLYFFWIGHKKIINNNINNGLNC